jgi:polysaccharide deacetylase 2 family uncharacterized protein YibQ
VIAVAWLASRRGGDAREATPAELVRAVAARLGHDPARVVAERDEIDGLPQWTVTFHAPRGADVDRFVLDVEADVHNRGGRLEERPLTERGGYGLARLEGEVGGARLRVVVLGDEPPEARVEAARRPTGEGRLAIVLDDAGYDRRDVEAVARLPREVAVAVLPNATHAAAVAAGLAAQRREVLVHMPMQPLDGDSAATGPGALEVDLADDEIVRRTEAALEVVAGARGLNNHMGSRATADARVMAAVMRVLAAHRLYFLDSRTTPDTVAERVARRAGVPTIRRDVFLDVVDDPVSVRQALRRAVARARSRGSAVAIGHVHPVTLAVLEGELPGVLDGVRLVKPSSLAR